MTKFDIYAVGDSAQAPGEARCPGPSARDQLVADQHSNTVDTKLAQTKALASLFGIPGTPSMVIGRTLVIGNISPRQIKALIEIERTDPGGPCALNA